MVAEANRLRVNLDTAYKLRVFADPKKGYTDLQLGALCMLCETNGRALGFSFVVKFLTIHNKIKRAKFQRDAITEGSELDPGEAGARCALRAASITRAGWQAPEDRQP